MFVCMCVNVGMVRIGERDTCSERQLLPVFLLLAQIGSLRYWTRRTHFFLINNIPLLSLLISCNLS